MSKILKIFATGAIIGALGFYNLSTPPKQEDTINTFFKDFNITWSRLENYARGINGNPNDLTDNEIKTIETEYVPFAFPHEGHKFERVGGAGLASNAKLLDLPAYIFSIETFLISRGVE
jgi:hypothetical protein